MTYEDALMARDAMKQCSPQQIADLEAHNTLAAVQTFMRTAGQEVKPCPGQPTPEVLKLRLAIMLEELVELADAFGLQETFSEMMYPYAQKPGFGSAIRYDSLVYNAVEVLDALVDGRYVADGTVLACGLQAAFPEAFANVQASNMSKFPDSQDVADDTIDDYFNKGILTQSFASDGGRWVIKRISDGKVLKSIAYVPASLGPILAKY